MSERKSETTDVYIVLGSFGEYSDRVEWVAAVYTDKTTAVQQATDRLRQAKADHVVYDKWCQCRTSVVGLRWPVSDELEAAAIKRCGPMPPGGDPADDYTVVRAVLNKWRQGEPLSEKDISDAK